MKKMFIQLMVLILICSIAAADDFVTIKPGDGTLTEDEVKKFASAFFSKKCGIDEERFDNANWEIAFGHSSLESPAEAYWSISVRSIKQHERIHYMELTEQGEILYWEAHGPGYVQENPGLLDNAVIVEPLESDIQQREVIQLVTEQMVSLGYSGPAESQQLIVEAYFVYDDHFNAGKIPVWLVKIELANGDLWKAAITHNGVILSLTEYNRDYVSYTTPGEDFWVVNFPGEEYFVERDILAGVLECTLSFEDRAFHTGRWRTLVLEWIDLHPYYLNNPGIEYEVAIENIYGIPDVGAISPEQAKENAIDYLNVWITDDLFITRRTIRTNYFVTDAVNPLWVIYISPARGLTRRERAENPSALKRYIVYVEAFSGLVSNIEID